VNYDSPGGAGAISNPNAQKYIHYIDGGAGDKGPGKYVTTVNGSVGGGRGGRNSMNSTGYIHEPEQYRGWGGAGGTGGGQWSEFREWTDVRIYPKEVLTGYSGNGDGGNSGSNGYVRIVLFP
jgi:hypothetical protein